MIDCGLKCWDSINIILSDSHHAFAHELMRENVFDLFSGHLDE